MFVQAATAVATVQLPVRRVSLRITRVVVVVARVIRTDLPKDMALTQLGRMLDCGCLLAIECKRPVSTQEVGSPHCWALVRLRGRRWPLVAARLGCAHAVALARRPNNNGSKFGLTVCPSPGWPGRAAVKRSHRFV